MGRMLFMKKVKYICALAIRTEFVFIVKDSVFTRRNSNEIK
jgi:hypothetical protein